MVEAFDDTRMRVKVGEGGRLPTRAHTGDAAWDLYVSETTLVLPQAYALVPSGIQIQPPPHIWYQLLGRSSTSNKKGLIVIPAVIDNGYRGLLFANVFNPGTEPVKIEAGDRVAQIVPFRLHAPNLQMLEVVELDDSERGVGGFGSTGR